MDGGSRTTAFILSYNRPDMLMEALDSIMAQTRVLYKVVILDNCSSADNLSKIKLFSEGRATVISTDINHSSVWNVKRAINYADNEYKNDYIYIMHDDDRVSPKFIEKMTEMLDSHPEASAAFPNGYTIDQSGKRTGMVGRENDSGSEMLADEKSVSLSYAMGKSVPFPFVVYRNISLQAVKLDIDLGLLIDVAIMCHIAFLGPIDSLQSPAVRI